MDQRKLDPPMDRPSRPMGITRRTSRHSEDGHNHREAEGEGEDEASLANTLEQKHREEWSRREEEHIAEITRLMDEHAQQQEQQQTAMAVKQEEEAERDREARLKALDFWDKFTRHIRAIRASQVKSRQTMQKIRGIKKALVETASILQVTQRLKVEDEASIYMLKRDLEASRKDSSRAKAQADEAQRIIAGLKREVFRLKTLLRTAGVTDVIDMKSEIEDKRASRKSSVAQGVYTWESLYEDAVADASMARPITPFQEWKITRGLWTPDCPAASSEASSDVLRGYYLHGKTPGGGLKGVNNDLLDESVECNDFHTNSPIGSPDDIRRLTQRSKNLLFGSQQQAYSQAMSSPMVPHTDVCKPSPGRGSDGKGVMVQRQGSGNFGLEKRPSTTSGCARDRQKAVQRMLADVSASSYPLTADPARPSTTAGGRRRS